MHTLVHDLDKTKYIKHTCKVVKSGSITEIYVYDNQQFKTIKQSNKKTDKKAKKKIETKIKTDEKYTRKERTINRTKRDLKRLIYANIGQYKELDKFITLTFKEKPTRDEVMNKFKQFNRRLKAQYKNYDYEYIAVVEQGTKNTKRLHLHCLFFGLPYIPQEELQAIWQYGIVDVRKISDYYDVARYVVKYISKTLSDTEYIPKGKKAYTTSRGLKKPIEQYWDDEDVIEDMKEKDFHILYQNRYNNVYIGDYNYYKIQTERKK